MMRTKEVHREIGMEDDEVQLPQPLLEGELNNGEKLNRLLKE